MTTIDLSSSLVMGGLGGAANLVALQTAINSADRIILPAGVIRFDGTIIIPQAKALQIEGEVREGVTLVEGVPGADLFSYAEIAGNQPSHLTMQNLRFVENGSGRTTRAVKWIGLSDAGRETHLKMRHIVADHIAQIVHSEHSRALELDDITATFTNMVVDLGRDASFVTLRNVYAEGCGGLLNAFDATPDGYSNTIRCTGCTGVGNTGIDYCVKGWQYVKFWDCASDLNGSGPANVWFENCQEVAWYDGWIATREAVVPTRYGMRLVNTKVATITGTTFQQHDMAIGCYSAPGAPLVGASLNISDTTFMYGATNDIIIVDCNGFNITNTFHQTNLDKGPSRPVWAGEISVFGVSGAGTIRGTKMASPAFSFRVVPGLTISDNQFSVPF